MPTQKLSQSIAEKLKTGGNDEVYFDEKLPGFGVRVSKNGTKSWIIQTRSNGRQIKRKIGRIDVLGYGEARSQAIDIFRKIQVGSNPFENKKEIISKFDELFSTYMENHALKLKKPRSAKEDQRLIKNHLLPRLKRISPKQLSRQDILDLKNSVAGLKSKISASTNLSRAPKGLRGGRVTSNRCLALLQKVMNFAISEGHLDRTDNPVSGTPRFKEYRKEIYLDVEQVGFLRRAIRKSRKLRTERVAALDAIEVLLLTGARRSEINDLDWAEVDLTQGALNLRDSKTGFRKIALCARSQQILKRRAKTRNDGTDLVFPGRLEVTSVSLRKPWERLKREAGIGPEYSLHTLRHTYATLAAASGINAWELQELLGHKSIETTSIYVKVAERQTRGNVQAISDLLRFGKMTQK